MSNQMKQISIRPLESIVSIDKEDEQTSQLVKQQNLQQQIQTEKMNLQSIKEQQFAAVQEAKEWIAIEQKNWETEKKRISEEATKSGYADGFEQGEKDGLASYDDKIAKANRIIDATREDYHNELDKSSETILELAIAVAERIIHKKLREEPSEFINIVQDAIHDIKGQSKVSVLISSTNYELVNDFRSELQRMLGRDGKLMIYVNEDLNDTDCIIEHQFGQIEVSIDSQLTKIREALTDYLMETNAK